MAAVSKSLFGLSQFYSGVWHGPKHLVDVLNRIIDRKTQQAQRQYKRQAVATPQPTKPAPTDAFNDMPADEIIDAVVPTNLKGTS